MAASTKAGIYTITNTVNGKQYVGSSVNVERRWKEHKSTLRNGTHGNSKLRNAANKYGIDSLKFEQIVSIRDADVDKETLFKYEDLMFKELQPELNLAPVAGSTLGYKQTAEQRKRNSEAMKVKHASDPEYREKMAAATAAAAARPDVKAKHAAAAARPDVRAKHAAATAAAAARPDVKAKHAAATKTSWEDESVRAARSTNHNVTVTVNGETIEHTSTKAAFKHYGLPTAKHIRFRKKLKASGRETFVQDGQDYLFTLIGEPVHRRPMNNA
jgi:group I intron endonuclease